MSSAAAAAWERVLALLAAGVLLPAGCNWQVAPVVPVSGRVLLNSKPLAGATVTFQPTAAEGATTPGAMGSVGKTDAQGRFVLRLVEPDRIGAVPGKHAVFITTTTATSDDSILPQGERVPRSWRDGSRTFIVPAAGTSRVLFEIDAP